LRSRRNVQTPQPKRSVVWPAYLVGAVCFIIALLSTIANITLVGQVRQAQTEAAQLEQRSSALARSLASVRMTLSDVLNPQAQHYRSAQNEVIVLNSHVYVIARNLAPLTHGRIYQTWIRLRNGQHMIPSLTFIPNEMGMAIIPLPVDARSIAEVAVSIEADGSTKQLTGKPLIDITLVSV
jgi:hypothetical protein